MYVIGMRISLTIQRILHTIWGFCLQLRLFNLTILKKFHVFHKLFRFPEKLLRIPQFCLYLELF